MDVDKFISKKDPPIPILVNTISFYLSAPNSTTLIFSNLISKNLVSMTFPYNNIIILIITFIFCHMYITRLYLLS
jgi:hypothetical protein